MTLTKKQIDKIIQLRKEGYTYKEIAIRVKCSESAAKKYWYKHRFQEELSVKDEAYKSLIEDDIRAQVEKNSETINKLLVLLADSVAGSSNAIYSVVCSMEESGSKEDAIEILCKREIEVFECIFHVDSDLAKKKLSEHKPWDLWTAEFDEFWTANLKRWVNFLKEYAPEFLAELF